MDKTEAQLTLIKYKKPTEYSFYKWIKEYPNSVYWFNRIKKYPNLKLSPLIDSREFYTFIKTACNNNALNWQKWKKIEQIILKEIPILKQNDLKELQELFERLIIFYKKTPAIRDGYNVEFLYGIKQGYYIERSFEHGKFYEKELPVDEPEGGIAMYDEKTKKWKELI